LNIFALIFGADQTSQRTDPIRSLRFFSWGGED